jgi:hypothetical protein
MMDPITAIGVAGNVIQFLDFGVKAVSKAREIHDSSTGALVEHTEIGVLTEDIARVAVKLAASAGAATGNDSLDSICEQCTIVAKELLDALKEMKADGKKSRIKSARKALKAMWGKKRVEDMKRRLEGYRDEIQFHVLVDLKLVIIGRSYLIERLILLGVILMLHLPSSLHDSTPSTGMRRCCSRFCPKIATSFAIR